MNTEKPLIKLYRKRSFSEKMSDTFDFIGENFRTLLKYVTYLLLPVALVQSFCMTNFMSSYMQAIDQIGGGKSIGELLPWIGSMGLYMLVQFVAIILLYALTTTMMQLYEKRPDRLQSVTFADLRPGIVKLSLRQLVLLLTGIVLMGVIVLVMVLLIAISPLLILPAVLLLIVVAPLFTLVYPIYLFEDTDIVSAYSKSVRLGWQTWGGIVAVIFVLYIISSILQGLVSTPWYIMVVAKSIFSMRGDTGGFVSSFGYTAIQYLLGVLSCFCGTCMMVLMVVGIAYQYGHACDKIDGVGVDQDIEHFETLNT